jgi:hypothetical protein
MFYSVALPISRSLETFHFESKRVSPCMLLVGMQAGATTLEKNWSLLKNLNIELPYDPAIPLLGIYPKECTQVTPEAPAHPCLLRHYS